MNAVIGMSHDEIEAMQLPSSGQKVEQGHRIRSPGDGYQRRPARKIQVNEE
jgi:hypothetical protein